MIRAMLALTAEGLPSVFVFKSKAQTWQVSATRSSRMTTMRISTA